MPEFYLHYTAATHEAVKGPFESVEDALEVCRRAPGHYASLSARVVRYGGGDTAEEIRENGEFVADVDDYAPDFYADIDNA